MNYCKPTCQKLRRVCPGLERCERCGKTWITPRLTAAELVKRGEWR